MIDSSKQDQTNQEQNNLTVANNIVSCKAASLVFRFSILT